MTTRKELFNTKNKKAEPADLVNTRVAFLHKDKKQRKKGELRQLSSDEKMICAIRKVLARMTDENEDGARYYLDGNQVRVTTRQDAPGAKEGEPGTYYRRGRCKIGIAHKNGGAAFQVVEFELSYRDSKDTLGLADVEYYDPTSFEQLPGATEL